MTREVVATPLDTLFTGVEVQATVADNLLQQDFVRRPEHAVVAQTLFVLALGAIIGALGSAAGPIGAAVGLVVLLLGCWTASIALLSAYGLYLSPLFATFALVCVLGGLSVASLSVEHEGTRQARRELSDSQRLMVETLLSLVEARDTRTVGADSKGLAQGFTTSLPLRDFTPGTYILRVEASPTMGNHSARRDILFEVS